MSIETNQFKASLPQALQAPAVRPAVGSYVDSLKKGFVAVAADDGGYFTHPITGKPLYSLAISLSTDLEDVKVEYADGSSTIIPAGILEMGVKHAMNIVKVFETGTGGSVQVFVWYE